MTLLDERMATPVHQGALEGADAHACVGNPACGDVLTLHLAISDGVITRASFESLGSPFQVATADVLCDCVTGQAIADARARSPACVLGKLPDLPARNRYLARLAIDALQQALDHFEHGPPTRDPEGRLLGPGEAEALVRGLLQDGQATTADVDALLADQGVRLPGSTLRFLNHLRREGQIVGSPTKDRHWSWCLPGTPAK